MFAFFTYKTQQISYKFKKKTWACDHLKTSNLSADNFTKILGLDGSTSEPAIRSGDAAQRIECFDSCQLITTVMYNMCAYQSSCAPKLARKCKIDHWFPCNADGRACRRCTDTWLTNFLGWVDLLTHGTPRARFERQSSATTLSTVTTAITHTTLTTATIATTLTTATTASNVTEFF